LENGYKEEIPPISTLDKRNNKKEKGECTINLTTKEMEFLKDDQRQLFLPSDDS